MNQIMGFEGIKDSTTTVYSGSSSSSEENDDQKLNETTAAPAAGAGRFYECMYCKRGFTNAQALGGHMNIHRKEKAKAKKQKAEATSKQLGKSSSREDLASAGGDRARTKYYEVPLGGQMTMGYRNFFPGQNPSYDRGDLSLSMEVGGHSHHQRDVGNIKESEVDLELRLGMAL